MSRQNSPGALRFRQLVFVIVATVVWPFHSALAALPDYKLGEVAIEDVITPVSLLVMNQEATEVLKQRVAEQVPVVVRHTPQSAAEVETELRQSIATARAGFARSFQAALTQSGMVEAERDRSVFAMAVANLSREVAKEMPLEQLAQLWIRGESDEPFLENLLNPLREVMAQPIVSGKVDMTFAPSQRVRLISVGSLNESLSAALDHEGGGQIVSAENVFDLSRARRVVETYFPAGQESLGRFAAAFVRVNAAPDATLTQVLRARSIEGVTSNDRYDAAQAIVRKGQIIDRKALSALAVMREKSLVGALQMKLEQEQSVASRITDQTKWIAASLGAMGAVLILILGRVRARPSTALVPVAANTRTRFEEWDPKALPGGASPSGWQQRALVAESKAERAHEAIRAGVLGWMREKIFRTMFRHRDELLSAQQKAEAEMRELEQRLEQLHTPLQERIKAYEKRIEELERDLAAKGEENRKLIGAGISVAKQQLISEQRRDRFGTN